MKARLLYLAYSVAVVASMAVASIAAWKYG